MESFTTGGVVRFVCKQLKVHEHKIKELHTHQCLNTAGVCSIINNKGLWQDTKICFL